MLKLASIGALAFISACVAHEAVGHGGTCLALGSRVTLLTFVHFHCAEGGPVTDAAGPLAGLALGGAILLYLRKNRQSTPGWRVFLALAMAFNLLWASGYFILSAILNIGDWAFVLRALQAEPRWLWRTAMGILGTFLYYRSVQLTARFLPPGVPVLIPYLTAAAVAVLAADVYTGGPFLPALREGLQESVGAAAGLLLIPKNKGPQPDISSNWIIAAALLVPLFLLTLGRGFLRS